MTRVPCAILGSGNIGTDLMMKLMRSSLLEVTAVVGIDPASDGLRRARAAGLDVSTQGAAWIVERADECAIVFDATSASAHREHAQSMVDAGIQIVDLTPAKLGPGVVPVVNMPTEWGTPNINLVTCGGQATIPMVTAVSRVAPVEYAEIVATISSRSAGPGTRNNIDEFTSATARGLEEIGGAEEGKAIIILNPAEPPILMRNSVFCRVGADADVAAIQRSVVEMEAAVREYVPGYRLRTEPLVDEGVVTVFLEVEGAGDYLPAYAGNLDIMTSAAVRVGEEIARIHRSLTGIRTAIEELSA
jgi:acetaldehyde dehydrogenase